MKFQVGIYVPLSAFTMTDTAEIDKKLLKEIQEQLISNPELQGKELFLVKKLLSQTIKKNFPW